MAKIYNANGDAIKSVADYDYLSEKSYFAIGDSIVQFAGTLAEPYTREGVTLYGYTQMIEAKYGLTCTNYGQGGHTIVQDYATLYALDYSNVTLVTIGYGVNDGRTNVTLGSRDSSDTTTFAGALGSLISKIYSDNPDCRVVVLTPIQRLYVNSWGSYTENSNGDTLEDFAEMCKAVAAYHGTPCVDAFHNSGLNADNLEALTFEGVHPLDKGYNRLGNCIISVLDGLFWVEENFD